MANVNEAPAVQSAVNLVEAVVKRGHILLSDGKRAKPGDRVLLDAAEVERLRSLGFLLDPEHPASPPFGEGPSALKVDGVNVKVT